MSTTVTIIEGSGLTRKANTDGADTIRSSHIKFNNWRVYNGDDSISLKANSTDITITNSHFYDGLGIALGSIGQYYREYETIERLRVENIHYHNTLHAVRNHRGCDSHAYPDTRLWPGLL